mmetsp:Transcript_107601/g.302990  ORF Transcript_107601/g.302990 Transcript_107601/m.302990 type:complete len:205 (-) Transcript_107601:38-652(-)
MLVHVIDVEGIHCQAAGRTHRRHRRPVVKHLRCLVDRHGGDRIDFVLFLVSEEDVAERVHSNPTGLHSLGQCFGPRRRQIFWDSVHVQVVREDRFRDRVCNEQPGPQHVHSDAHRRLQSRALAVDEFRVLRVCRYHAAAWNRHIANGGRVRRRDEEKSFRVGDGAHCDGVNPSAATVQAEGENKGPHDNRIRHWRPVTRRFLVH